MCHKPALVTDAAANGMITVASRVSGLKISKVKQICDLLQQHRLSRTKQAQMLFG